MDRVRTRFLPTEVLWENRERLYFISTTERDAVRVVPSNSKDRNVIVLSDRILPKSGWSEDQPRFRYFVFAVLHEFAHAVQDHQPPNQISHEEDLSQEDEADDLAIRWFNSHIEELDNPHLVPISKEEISKVEQHNKQLMKNLHSSRQNSAHQ